MHSFMNTYKFHISHELWLRAYYNTVAALSSSKTIPRDDSATLFGTPPSHFHPFLSESLSLALKLERELWVWSVNTSNALWLLDCIPFSTQIQRGTQ